MAKQPIDQKAYLKKYLKSDKDDKKKKKKKVKPGVKTVKIIDDDIDLSQIRPMNDDDLEIFNRTEDAPQIVGIIDDRGPVDFADRKRWKIIADDGDGNVAIEARSRDIEVKRELDDNLSQKSMKIHRNEQENGNIAKIPPKKSRKQSDDDLSPPRNTPGKKKSKKRRKKSISSESSSSSSSDSSSDSEADRKRKSKSKKSKNRGKSDQDSDLSPPRKKGQNKSDSDLSPPRKSQRSSENSRKNQRNSRRNDDSDLSPPRKSRRDDVRSSKRDKSSDSDLSPPRKSQRDARMQRNDDSDLSPPRKSRRDENPRNSRRDRRSDSDLSPPRSDRNDSRRNRNDPHRRNDSRSERYKPEPFKPRGKPSRWNEDDRRKSRSPTPDKRMKKTLDGKTAGLQDAKALREETLSHKRREKELFSQMSAEVSGRGQAAVLRDRKTGKRRDLEAEAAEKREKERQQAEIDEKYSKWGRGLKQVNDTEQKLQDDLYEMSKPLARYADDADLDASQRAEIHDTEDTMAAYIKKKQIASGKRQPDAPRYEGSSLPNRFGIKPGRRWDGVDRSNGYEKKWFEARNAKKALQQEAYKWSTADM